MNIVLGTFELTTIGGVGTYVVTVGEQLERMGHDVAIVVEERGEMAAIAEERGLLVVSDAEEGPQACDAVYAQDAPSAYRLAERYPDTPQAFCLHATDHDRWMVPQLPGVTSVTVVLHERAARFARSLAHTPRVVRLRQPVDTMRFTPRGEIGAAPRRALALGNYTTGNRLAVIRDAFAAEGVEVVHRGLQGGGFAPSPELEINDYDVVIGKSRVIVEAMACGRAAYVCDYNGCDGWVTPERYERLEADNFDGQADHGPIDSARLRGDLAAYRAQMGPANRDLAVANHGARAHAEALVDLFSSLSPRTELGVEPLDELGRLTRVQWQADARALGFEHEARLLRAELARRDGDQLESEEQVEIARRRASEAPGPAGNGGSGGPEIAVVVPLENPRGDVAEHLRTWIHDQTLARERYRVVIGASGEYPDAERRLAEQLAPQDEIVRAPDPSLFGLYQAAANGAGTPLLVITEAHVRADPGCLAAVADAFAADPELDGASFVHNQSVQTPEAELIERWFERAWVSWDLEDWHRLPAAGFAIRASAYDRVGGLDPQLELFAPFFMSARLDDAGARVGHLDSAVVTHVIEDELTEALEHACSHARGECVARAKHDERFVQRYFPPPGFWKRRLEYRREIAGSMVAALAAAIRRRPRDALWLGREMATHLPAGAAGPLPRLAWEKAAARLHQAVAESDRVPFETRWRSLIASHEHNVGAIGLQQGVQTNDLPMPAPLAGSLSAEQLAGVLAGAHMLEGEEGNRFRWVEPVALLRVSPPEGGALLRLDTGGLRGPPLHYLHGVYSGGLSLPPELIGGDDETLELRLPPDFARQAARKGIVFICRPLVPTGAGSSDTRRLGMPVVSAALSAP